MARILAFRKRAASSTSPMIGMPKVRASSISGVFGRDAGADDDQVLAAEGEQAVAAGFDIDARVEQRRDVPSQRLSAAQVRNRDLRPTPPQKECRCKTRTPNPTTRTFLPLSSTRESLTEMGSTLPSPFSRDSFAPESQNAEDAHEDERHAANHRARDGLPKHPCPERDRNERIHKRVAGHLARGDLSQQPHKAGECQQRPDEDQVDERKRRTPPDVGNVMQLPACNGKQQTGALHR